MRDPNPLDESIQRLLSDFFHYDPQPNCPVCGRFGRRVSGGWALDCLSFNTYERLWEHDMIGGTRP